MTTSSEHSGQSAHAEAAGMTLQTDGAKATVAEIMAENAALKKANQAAEAETEATTEQVKQMAQATEEILEELQEMKEGADQE